MVESNCLSPAIWSLSIKFSVFFFASKWALINLLWLNLGYYFSSFSGLLKISSSSPKSLDDFKNVIYLALTKSLMSETSDPFLFNFDSLLFGVFSVSTSP